MLGGYRSSSEVVNRTTAALEARYRGAVDAFLGLILDVEIPSGTLQRSADLPLAGAL